MAKPSLSSPQTRQGPQQPPPCPQTSFQTPWSTFPAHGHPQLHIAEPPQGTSVNHLVLPVPDPHPAQDKPSANNSGCWKAANKDVVVIFYTAHVCFLPCFDHDLTTMVRGRAPADMRGAIQDPLGHLSLKGEGENPASGHSVKGGIKAGVSLPSGRTRRFHGSNSLASPSAWDPPNPVSSQGGV